MGEERASAGTSDEDVRTALAEHGSRCAVDPIFDGHRREVSALR
jgi:hypothetical protein